MPAPSFPRWRPRAVDLFSGAGGMSLGFEQAGFDVVAAVEMDGYHAAAHHFNFPAATVMCRSVVGLRADELRHAADVDGEIELVFGGPPCQGFSSMGARDAGDVRNSLVGEFVRLVGELRPKFVVMENVPGMQLGDTAPIFDQALAGLAAAGYVLVRPARTLNAKDFGVPQDRERLFVIGARADLGVGLRYPAGPLPGQPARPTVAEALAGLPDVDQDESLLRSDRCKRAAHPAQWLRYARVAWGIERDPTDASRPRRASLDGITGCMRVRHDAKTVALYEATRPGMMVPGHKLPRLAPEGIAPTLRAGTGSEHGSHTAPRPVHPHRPRCITVREAARLHGFPDWFSFYPAKLHAYRQIGNAVCPQVARAVGRELIRALGVSWTARAPAAVVLPAAMALPEGRPRGEKRLPQIDEFPRVIARLMARAGLTRGSAPKSPEFTHRDIAAAMSESGARLPRVRPESFLAAVRRSRNVSRILSEVREVGYSILQTSDGGVFVPRGTAGSIDDNDSIKVRSDALTSAPTLRVNTRCSLAIPGEAISLLELATVQRALLGRVDGKLTVERGLFGATVERRVPFVWRPSMAPAEAGIAMWSSGKAPPRRSQVLRALTRARRSLGAIIVALTQEHVMIGFFRRSRRGLRDLGCQVFRLRASRRRSGAGA